MKKGFDDDNDDDEFEHCLGLPIFHHLMGLSLEIMHYIGVRKKQTNKLFKIHFLKNSKIYGYAF